MTEPSPAELLAGVAEALEKTVLPDLERGPIRNQVMAAIGIVRRCGGAIDRYGPFLHADCADLIATLRQASGADPALVVDSTAQSFDDVTGAAAEGERIDLAWSRQRSRCEITQREFARIRAYRPQALEA